VELSGDAPPLVAVASKGKVRVLRVLRRRRSSKSGVMPVYCA